MGADEYPEGSFGYEVERMSARYTELAGYARTTGTYEGEITARAIEHMRDEWERRFRDMQDAALARVLEATR